MRIPDHLYNRVLETATSLMTASEAGDTKRYRTIYNELKKLCESKTRSGEGHPFLWETLADFTQDDSAAVDLYMKALEEAQDVDAAAYRASILFALAERQRSLGNATLAYKYALDANEEARSLDDPELRRDISEFLRDEGKDAAANR